MGDVKLSVKMGNLSGLFPRPIVPRSIIFL